MESEHLGQSRAKGFPYTENKNVTKKANTRGTRGPLESLGTNMMPARCMHGDGVSR